MVLASPSGFPHAAGRAIADRARHVSMLTGKRASGGEYDCCSFR